MRFVFDPARFGVENVEARSADVFVVSRLVLQICRFVYKQ